MPELISLSVMVTGRVQGVCYRASVRDWAIELGVMGWVRNNADGSVSALLQHESQESLTELLSRMRHGPVAAVVGELLHECVENHPACPDFSIQR